MTPRVLRRRAERVDVHRLLQLRRRADGAARGRLWARGRQAPGEAWPPPLYCEFLWVGYNSKQMC
jgi:hypothetical protein